MARSGYSYGHHAAMTSSYPKRIFLSAVTSELKSYRDAIAGDLRLPHVDVKVQEDFVNGGGTTLEKIDDYIRISDAVVHLIGDALALLRAMKMPGRCANGIPT